MNHLTLGAFVMSPSSLHLLVALVALVGCGNSGSKISKESTPATPSSAPTTTTVPTSTSTGTPSSQPSASVVPTSSQTNQPPTPVCPPEAPGPAMAVVKAPSGVSYCIDTTEVTQSQYKQFLDQASNFKPSWPELCKDTKLAAPEEDEENTNLCGQFYRPEQRPNAPMTCVTWCQAHAYCEWAGKHLCGKIGGGSVEKNANANANVSEWYNTCSSGGKHLYPYGDEYKSEFCTDKTWLEKTSGVGASCNNATCLPDVKSSPSCHAGETDGPQVFDISGSVSEWENSVVVQKGFASIVFRRGSFLEPGKDCKDFGYTNPAVPNGVVGFRCCADAK